MEIHFDREVFNILKIKVENLVIQCFYKIISKIALKNSAGFVKTQYIFYFSDETLDKAAEM